MHEFIRNGRPDLCVDWGLGIGGYEASANAPSESGRDWIFGVRLGPELKFSWPFLPPLRTKPVPDGAASNLSRKVRNRGQRS